MPSIFANIEYRKLLEMNEKLKEENKKLYEAYKKANELAVGLCKDCDKTTKQRDAFEREFHHTLDCQVKEQEKYEKEIQKLKEENEKLKEKLKISELHVHKLINENGKLRDDLYNFKSGRLRLLPSSSD